MAPPTNRRRAFCVSSARTRSSRTTSRTVGTSTTAAVDSSGGDPAHGEETDADVGITHDGDADRVLLCDENGEVVDGDEILAIAALDFLNAGRLSHNTVVATVMSNFGLDETLAVEWRQGPPHQGRGSLRHRGDDAERLNVGGEQSGHMIFRDFSTTGDGIVSALQILRIMEETGKPLSELKRVSQSIRRRNAI